MRVQIWAEHTLRAGRRCHADEIGEGCDVGETEVNIFEGTPDELRYIVSAYRRNAERDPGHQHAYELLKARTLEDAIDDET